MISDSYTQGPWWFVALVILILALSAVAAARHFAADRRARMQRVRRRSIERAIARDEWLDALNNYPNERTTQ